jgi:phosphomannomutase/phosphoglucomutase
MMGKSGFGSMPGINPHLIRGYSIRGVADRDLTDAVVARIGYATGEFFRQRDARSLVVGRDGRLSSPRISQALIHGLLQAGLAVTDVGMLPTPAHNFATDWYGAAGGVMVTASHNPPDQNGLKIRAGRTLSNQELQHIYRIAAEGAALSPPEPPDAGALTQADPLPDYLEQLAAHARLSRPLTVVVDGGNGTNGPMVSGLLQRLGCQVTELFCQPDGRFPNRDPDPTAPGATDPLAAAVRAAGADLGLAYDGDGDRLAVVDDRGHRVWGDQVLMLLARDVLSQGPASIVYEILCTQALADDIRANGGRAILTACGYAFVHQAVLDNGAALGGELSGHLFLNRAHFRFDDAILGTVQLLNIMSSCSRPLSALVEELPAYYSSPPLRLTCPDSLKERVVQQAKEYFRARWPVDELDGVRVDFGDGWALLRASNTQPALSLRFEARSQARLEQLTRLVLDQVGHWMAAHG